MDNNKRRFLKGAAAAGGAGLFVAGYSDSIKHIANGVTKGTSGEVTKNAIYGNALDVEYKVDLKDGNITANEKQRVANTMCLGCWSKCGVRAKIDNETDEILRITGNPYHPLSGTEGSTLKFDTPIKDAFVSLSGYQEAGLQGRSTACARGNAMLENLTSKHRVTECLKRVGPRGSGKWQVISFEQLVSETVNGGDLFGEGHVEGLKDIRDTKTRLDPNNPEYGPKSNQLLVTDASDDGREVFTKRFTFNSFGSRNWGNHGSYCGFSYRAGSGAVMDDLKKYAHVKPDWSNSKFLLFIGTSPQQSGNPFKRSARELANARVENGKDFSYAVVSPMLPNTSNMPCAPKNRWIPIKPATDSALAMAMIQWIIENERYADDFLTAPNFGAAKAAGYNSHNNASHLVFSDTKHPKYGKLVKASDIGLPIAGKPNSPSDDFVVLDAKSGVITKANDSQKAQLFVDSELETTKGKVAVKSSMALLKASAFANSLQDYSEACSVPVDEIIRLATEFTSHGKQAAVISHGGTMSTNGFDTAWSIMMLNVLIGNLNSKGGALASGGQYPAFGAGPRYNLKKFKGMVKPSGVFLSRSKFPYEKTSEFKRKEAAGENPYPAQQPWFPISPPVTTEHLTAALNGYPYKVKAWISHMTNPIYGMPGLRTALEDKLRDPKVLPLFISVDAFINETNAFSDYIVPDTLTYESWGWTSAWHDVPTKTSTGRWPVVKPRVVPNAEKDTVCMESYIIAISRAMGLPGFGEDAIKGHDGKSYPLTKSYHFSLYGGANVAYQKGKPVPHIDSDDLNWSGVERILPELTSTLTAEEAGKVAYLYARGGRFQDADEGRKPNGDPSKMWMKPMMIWNPTIGSRKNSITGEYFGGVPSYAPSRLADGTELTDAFKEFPLRISSYKSHTMSSMSIGSDRLRQVHSNNPVRINEQTAKRLGITTGDKVEISTPNGSRFALVEAVAGVHEDCLAIEHGFGHKELGASDVQIGDKVIKANPLIQVGINMNDLSVLDTSRKGRYPLIDATLGSAARQGLPAKIRKVS
ncbi:tetrathionate reductase subunit TtrA [Vibrio sp. SS-MA-C1-2]|uniref:molybdopterin dinucleotide binding domain-containing protein n=1 Tax=Vibrio sp. SS-MA-C1-2 TaxID=2908646 RepID=UPI001F2483AF|nr:molybdopterin dinucleotide binding domain-containing protein [Vibrio sp. SS-MA-C1-2]UJF17353.1 tetrathionate reductase subunit TtrA [Vibrio sp. SS-MA-C1-2]